jgi:hypothetical protein
MYVCKYVEATEAGHLMSELLGQALDHMIRVQFVLDPDPTPEMVTAAQSVEEMLQ